MPQARTGAADGWVRALHGIDASAGAPCCRVWAMEILDGEALAE